ncbi:single-stranded DNA-binding protein [Vibrio virus vB_VspP_SBP1]|uniref:Single-stranded DNA-binding protein n=1 Tax=Vibrio virus vB_VspP_SBP1 TaxID=2500581 RepID=A0A3T0III3_9CAUD|nr:single strand DNA binding protein [Vibrio virus vB_VspP_SBP1]AZU99635.1 single-stranded DNA-binding protein [Vibrio virus vB_VspP_SBP1]
MSFLKNLGKDKDIQQETDSLGGGAKESGLYKCVVEAAYLGVSKNGANSITIVAKSEEGHQFRETLWVTNKEGKEFYIYNDEKRFLPGYNVANAIALLTTGYELADLDDPEERTLNIYDFDEKKELPTQVDCLTQLHGEEIWLGILKEIQDKTKANPATGKYEPTGETREVNVIDKVFRAESGLTVAEARLGQDTGDFMDKWVNKWSGKTRDKSKGAAAAGKAGAPNQSAAKPKSSLFKK